MEWHIRKVDDGGIFTIRFFGTDMVVDLPLRPRR
jgi:hypothetical protein